MFFFPLRLAFKAFSLLVPAAIVYLVVSGFQVLSASRLSTNPATVSPARAIVVLGAPVSAGRPEAELLGRLAQALALFKADRAPAVVVTGSSDTADSVTAVAESWLFHRGVARADLLRVTAGDDALGLSGTTALLGRGAHVVVVTSALNSLWTAGAARAAGLVAQVSPPPGTKKSFYDELKPLLAQASAVAVGRLVGFDRIGWA